MPSAVQDVVEVFLLAVLDPDPAEGGRSPRVDAPFVSVTSNAETSREIRLRVAARERDVLAGACLAGLPVVLVCALLANVLLVYSFWAVCGVSLACLNVLRREARERRGVAGAPAESAT